MEAEPGNVTTAPTSEELAGLFDQGLLAAEMAREFGLNAPAKIEEIAGRCAALHNAGTWSCPGFVDPS